LDGTETGPPSQRARCRQGGLLEDSALAGAKKNALQQHAWIFFQDESGFTQQPSVRTTWAPRGKTPVLKPRGNHWSKTSVAAALGFRWDGQRARLFARTKPDNYNAASLIDFLKALRRFAGGEKVILIWDHLPAHRSREMKQFLRSQWQWLQIEWLPGYAPDLNPTEGVWNNIKGKELANLCPDHIDEATVAFRRGLHRLSHTARLPFSFLRHTGLSF
jgi:transposase